MKSILKAANSQGASWTIGCRPSTNWDTGWFCVRRRARKGIRGFRLSLGPHSP
jgi:hypothetical protein